MFPSARGLRCRLGYGEEGDAAFAANARGLLDGTVTLDGLDPCNILQNNKVQPTEIYKESQQTAKLEFFCDEFVLISEIL